MSGRVDVSRQARTDQMAGAVWQTLYGPTGIAWRLPEAEQALLAETAIVVRDAPLANERALVEAKPSDHLLGLYTAGPGHGDALVQLFAAEIDAVGYDAADVITHELGHVFNYNHASRVAAVERDGVLGTVCADCAPRPMLPERVTAQRSPGGSDNCPMCLMHKHLAVAEKELDGIRQRAHLQHQIPLGLGGLILGARREVAAAEAALNMATPMLPDRQGQMRSLADLVGQLNDSLSGWLSPEDVSRAHALAYRAWDASFDANHVYWLRALHGSVDSPAAHLPEHQHAGHEHAAMAAAATRPAYHVSIDPAGPYSFGEQIHISTDAPVHPDNKGPWIGLACYQNGVQVLSGSHAGFPAGWYYGWPFDLGPTQSWSGGPAQCTCTVTHQAHHKTVVDARLDFNVDA